jgi:hypothetical protein
MSCHVTSSRGTHFGLRLEAQALGFFPSGNALLLCELVDLRGWVGGAKEIVTMSGWCELMNTIIVAMR